MLDPLKRYLDTIKRVLGTIIIGLTIITLPYFSKIIINEMGWGSFIAQVFITLAISFANTYIIHGFRKKSEFISNMFSNFCILQVTNYMISISTVDNSETKSQIITFLFIILGLGLTLFIIVSLLYNYVVKNNDPKALAKTIAIKDVRNHNTKEQYIQKSIWIVVLSTVPTIAAYMIAVLGYEKKISGGILAAEIIFTMLSITIVQIIYTRIYFSYRDTRIVPYNQNDSQESHRNSQELSTPRP
jgi:nitrate reductase NapE component